jgi:hypothetical protein
VSHSTGISSSGTPITPAAAVEHSTSVLVADPVCIAHDSRDWVLAARVHATAWICWQWWPAMNVEHDHDRSDGFGFLSFVDFVPTLRMLVHLKLSSFISSLESASLRCLWLSCRLVVNG